MSEYNKELNLFQRLSAITSEMKTVEKNLDIVTGKDKSGNEKSYKAVGEADVLKTVKPLEQKYGVYSYPHDREIIESKIIVTTSQYGDKQQQFLRIMVTFRFVNIDKPSEFIEVKSYGDGVDSQDKAPGKAMTYADKYALLKAYKVATGEDTDQYSSQELKDMVEVPMITKDQMTAIRTAYRGNEDKLATFLEKNNLDVLNQMTYESASKLIQTINSRKSVEKVTKQEEPTELSLDAI